MRACENLVTLAKRQWRKLTAPFSPSYRSCAAALAAAWRIFDNVLYMGILPDGQVASFCRLVLPDALVIESGISRTLPAGAHCRASRASQAIARVAASRTWHHVCWRIGRMWASD